MREGDGEEGEEGEMGTRGQGDEQGFSSHNLLIQLPITLRVRSRSWGKPPRPRCLTNYQLPIPHAQSPIPNS